MNARIICLSTLITVIGLYVMTFLASKTIGLIIMLSRWYGLPNFPNSSNSWLQWLAYFQIWLKFENSELLQCLWPKNSYSIYVVLFIGIISKTFLFSKIPTWERIQICVLGKYPTHEILDGIHGHWMRCVP